LRAECPDLPQKKAFGEREDLVNTVVYQLNKFDLRMREELDKAMDPNWAPDMRTLEAWIKLCNSRVTKGEAGFVTFCLYTLVV